MRRFGLLAFLLLAVPLVACGDDDGGSNTNCTDNDGDGYGVGDDCLGADCDDADPTVWASVDAYPDADGDGHYATEAETLCLDGSDIPATYSAQPGDDCDDTDAEAWQEMQGYMDADGDGLSAATAMAETLCTGGSLPAGYVDTLGTDCDDTDVAVFEEVSGYADFDQDGVFGADATSMVTACTDGSLPPGTQADPGTDCDDFDPFASSNEPTCQWIGVCMDTEGMGNSPAPDLRGIGACMSTDCNGTDSAVWEPGQMVTAGGNPVACPQGDECGAGQECVNGVCWVPNASCHTGTKTCSEMPDCLQQCKTDNPNDPALAAQCMQFQCYEEATPKAQILYMFAQQCSANAGCFAAADVQGCVMTYCAAEFVPCLGDTP